MGDKNFEEGSKDGQQDHKKGNGKSIFWRPIQRTFKLDTFLPGGLDRAMEYIRGYNTSYEDEVRTINTRDVSLNTTNTMKGENMNLEYQLELLGELNQYLRSVQDQMDSVRAEYARRVNELAEAGMIENNHNYLKRNIFNPTESALLKFIQHLEERDLATVKKEIDYVQAEIDRLNDTWD